MGQHKDNTNEVKTLTAAPAFHSLLYSCVFSLVETCSGDTVLTELTHHPLFYINIVFFFDYDIMCAAYANSSVHIQGPLHILYCSTFNLFLPHAMKLNPQ